MRRLRILMLAAVSVALMPTMASAAPCPYPQVQECRPAPPNRPPQCRCVNPPGSPTWGGKAEIHKKNVPTVKPNRGPGGNN